MNEINIEQEQVSQEKQLNYFCKLSVASLLYAFLYTFCIYNNVSGITMPIWIVVTIIYACYVLNEFGVTVKRDSILFMIIMLLFGFSTFLTGNRYIITLNYLGFFLLLMYFILYNLYNVKRWNYSKCFFEIFISICGALCCIATPLTDVNAYIMKKQKRCKKICLHVLLGILIAVPCVLLLGFCLTSADAVFERMIQNILKGFSLPKKVLGICAMLVFGFFSSYCGMRFLTKRNRNEDMIARKKLEPIMAITFTSLVATLYLVFCTIQIIYLFIGNRKLPDGMTYASYARTGFFQLLFVCFLNLILVLSVKKHFHNHKILDVVLMIISGCTFIMIASSAYRMVLYIKAYHLTFLRIFVLVSLLIVTFLMAGVVISIQKPNFDLLRYSVLVVSIIYLGFSFSHIDYFIASYNLMQANQELEMSDYDYLSSLSTDAAPAIINFVKQNKAIQDKVDDEMIKGQKEGEFDIYNQDDSISWYFLYLERNHSVVNDINIRNFNISHFVAAKLIK